MVTGGQVSWQRGDFQHLASPSVAGDKVKQQELLVPMQTRKEWSRAQAPQDSRCGPGPGTTRM